jgi:L-iditol 2-dehydrogenase
MKAVRLYATRDLRLCDETIPLLKSHFDTLINVTSIGVCGSDLHWFEESGIGDARLNQPLVLGHEFGAVIAGGPRAGERVAVDPAIPCMRCEYCTEGNSNLCEHTIFSGHGNQDGALREFMAWPAENLHRLPESLTDDDAAMLEPLGVAIHGVDLGHIKTGMTVGVFGAGPIGLLIQQVARVAGATTLYATDRRAHRLDAAAELGAHKTYQADDARSEAAAILSETRGRGVDVAFECAGDNAAVEAACAATKPGGTVVLMGIPADDRTAFTASIARRKGLTIRMARRMKPVYPRAIALLTQGRVNVRALVTHRFPLAQTAQAFAVAARREGLKVIVHV